MSRRQVICEGYHDRAFLAGLLLRLGCTDPGAGAIRRTVFDPHDGSRIDRGRFAFHSPSGAFIVLAPSGGKSRIQDQLKLELLGLSTKPRERIVICVDDDGDATSAPPTMFPNGMRSVVMAACPTARVEQDALVMGSTRLSSVTWWCNDAHAEGIPRKQTLERVVTAALAAAYPGRGRDVGEWLRKLAKGGPKEHAWAHMAGWYAEQGCEAFYRVIWDDDEVAKALEERLKSGGSWNALEALAG